ncbi:hypothetical protein N7539_000722 [Penicillium diatomitis]|uniref:Uncharacterized protein n=1 Tax=Penicillium diatomitis TaxID=2819901 RepID=A0A9W9XM75_9EURO|nr:uncharacterized protein N7539_000722 [Penicillium diatomitis]KAJ5495606.1 hypothetical protein N7539_000722 [Penicillium diatomitis]
MERDRRRYDSMTAAEGRVTAQLSAPAGRPLEAMTVADAPHHATVLARAPTLGSPPIAPTAVLEVDLLTSGAGPGRLLSRAEVLGQAHTAGDGLPPTVLTKKRRSKSITSPNVAIKITSEHRIEASSFVPKL